jgi:hypothetical protein
MTKTRRKLATTRTTGDDEGDGWRWLETMEMTEATEDD